MKNFKEREIIEQVEDSPNQQTTVKSFSSKIFGPTHQSYLSSNDEITYYLDNVRIPPALPDMDPFKWWSDNEKDFLFCLILQENS